MIFNNCLLLYSIFSISFSQEEQIHDFFHLLRIRSLTNFTCLTEHVTELTRNSNIIDLIVCPDNIINYITISDTFLSDYRILYADTLISAIVQSTAQKNKSLTPPPPYTRIET